MYKKGVMHVQLLLLPFHLCFFDVLVVVAVVMKTKGSLSNSVFEGRTSTGS